MSTIYRHNGFQLNKISDTRYTIDRGDIECAVIEKSPETHGDDWVVYRPSILGVRVRQSDIIIRSEGHAKTLKALFTRWVDENYGTAYSRKSR